ncbi:hypothetical protein HYU06_05360, partial [Candidatus Woesearchaeota archaeon]|nr:hypothetical protein [Candidatus Woesearchaeota archaeon]
MKKQLNVKTIILFLFLVAVLSSFASAVNYNLYQAFDYLNGTSGNVGTC